MMVLGLGDGGEEGASVRKAASGRKTISILYELSEQTVVALGES